MTYHLTQQKHMQNTWYTTFYLLGKRLKRLIFSWCHKLFVLLTLLLTVSCMYVYRYLYFSWVSVLQNSKEEALNTALGGDQLHLQDSGLQELSRAIIAELRHMPGNEACADCGAPGQPGVVDDHCRIKCGNASGD